MTEAVLILWAVLSLSLLNGMLMAWLGLTILLTAERRVWGIWLAGMALMGGAVFFFCHATLLGMPLDERHMAMAIRWPPAWLPAIALPFAWYLVMLWHAGFWENPASPLRRRHRPWLALTSLLFVTGAALLMKAGPLPEISARRILISMPGPMIGEVPAVASVFPALILLSIVLSLDVLRHPAPSRRMMGDLARSRARPWLEATSVVLLLVSLFVGEVMAWIALNQTPHAGITWGAAYAVAWADAFVCALVAVAILFLGQAIVSYEIFTGRTLPRNGLRRAWQRILVLAFGLSAALGISIALDLPRMFDVLCSALVVTLFFALQNWRIFAERERAIASLRPFITTPGMYRLLLDPDQEGAELAAPFRALCSEVLGAEKAFLLPLGAFAALVEPLAFPADAVPPPAGDLPAQCRTPQQLFVPVDPAAYNGAAWAVPLWSARGLVGVLLIGEKRDDGLYSEEEIEVARASGERLLDMLAGARLAQRLASVQRARLAESQVVDRRARRVLHDDILPQLHTAMLALSAGPEAVEGVLGQLSDVHRQLSNLLREMPSGAPEVGRLGLFGALRRCVMEEYCDAFDAIEWQLDPAAVEAADALSPITAEVLYCAAREAVRNAARHGRGQDIARPLHLRVAAACHDGLEVVIEDDGVGLDAVEEGAGGQGTVLHSTLMAVVGGTWAAESAAGRFTRVALSVPAESSEIEELVFGV